jgi:hypothetical protein
MQVAQHQGITFFQHVILCGVADVCMCATHQSCRDLGLAAALILGLPHVT